MNSSSAPNPSYECIDFNDIAKCFQKLHLHINEEVEMLKTRKTETERRVDLLENHIEFSNSEIQDLHNKYIPNLEDKIKAEETERLKLELWDRKWNVVIRGIKGAKVKFELPKVTETLTRQFLQNVLKFSPEIASSMLFTAVHRLPSGDDDRRSIVLRLSSLIDREDILKAATQLEPGSGFSVVPDLPPKLGILRSQLLKDRHAMPVELRKKTKLVYLREPPFLKLVTKEKNYG